MALTDSDVVVVGGGPCGSFSALIAAKLGLDVMVCEEHQSIGLPVHCPGHLSLSGLERLGLHLPAKIIENKFNGAVFCSPSGKRFEVRCGSSVTCVVNRRLFDRYLAELAMRTGAQFKLKARVQSLALSGGRFTGVVLNPHDSEPTLTSQIVIDAEGISSTLLKSAGIRTLDRSLVVKGVQAEIEGAVDLQDDTVEIYFGRRYSPGFFSWIIPKHNESAKIGLATNRGNPRDHLEGFMQDHPIASRKLEKAEVISLSLHPMSLGGPIPQTYSDGLLIVGDAASQVKPTTGGGVIFGLLCSKMAGEVAYEAVESNDLSEAFLSRYQSRWKGAIGFDLRMMGLLRRLLNRLSDRQMDKLISLCRRLEVNRVLEEGGDLDFQGRSLIHTIQHPSMLTIIVYSLFSSLTSLA